MYKNILMEVVNTMSSKETNEKVEVTTTTNEDTINIEEVIDRYAENNKNKKVLESVVKKDSDTIKSYILNHDNKAVDTEQYTADVSSVVKSTYKEEELIDYLKTLNIPGVIVTKEVIDMKALEDAVYHNQIKPEEIKPYIVNTTTYRLNVKALKKAKK
jgi:hypothetical protein